MCRLFTVIALFLLLLAAGCTGFQANRASQAVDIDPSAFGTGRQVVVPSNSFGYADGMPMDMRTK